MISLTLPPEDRRAVLRSFWIVISLILGTGLWLVGWWFQAPFPLTIGLIAGTACALLVFVNQEFVRRLYHAWNRRIVRPYANFASRAVMRICFFIILLATGKAGSRFGLGGHAVTSWERRSSLPAEAYGLPYAAGGEASARDWLDPRLPFLGDSIREWMEYFAATLLVVPKIALL